MSEEIEKTESLSPEKSEEKSEESKLISEEKSEAGKALKQTEPEKPEPEAADKKADEKTDERMKEEKEEAEKSREARASSMSMVTSVFEWIQPLLVALICVTMLLTFVFRQITVSGSSMYDTLEDGDRLIITNLFYEPEVGDIVVISHGQNYSSPLIKRVIALEGQTLSIDFETGDVVVDGVLLDEKYITGTTIEDRTSPLEVPSVIPEGYVYVMGDNREHSSDSRNTNIGLIKKSDIVGKAQFRIYPFSSFGSIY